VPASAFAAFSGVSAAAAAVAVPGYVFDRVLAEGSYGRIHAGRRTLYTPVVDAAGTLREYAGVRGSGRDVVLKELPVASPTAAAAEAAVRAALAEGVIHGLVHATLEAAGLPEAAPALLEVVARGPGAAASPADLAAVLIVMERVHGGTLWEHLSGRLRRCDAPAATAADDEWRAGNARLVLDVLVQLAVALDVLQARLRFNHRDLKVNNVMVRAAADAPPPPLAHAALQQPWRREHCAVLIDFGFACVECGAAGAAASAETHAAGTWFLPTDDCLRPGRDLAQLLYCLHCYFPLHLYLPRALYATLLRCCMATAPGGGPPVCLLRGVTEDGSPLTPLPPPPPAPRVPRAAQPQQPQQPRGRVLFHAGVYQFLQQPGATVPLCAPRALLHELRFELAKYA
jgi:serine/threonine protein kinase